MLRRLRHAAGLSLIELAGRLGDANVRMDAAHLQRIETGQIVRPTAETLESILTNGLDASYLVRRDVLDAFGYRLPWVLPTADEVELARNLCASEVATATWPTYVMDYALRIWSWNRYFPRLIGREHDDPAISHFIGLTHIEILLNPALGTAQQVVNASEFVPLMLTMFKGETTHHRHDAWFRELLERGRSWPGFTELWDRLPDNAHQELPPQPVLPISIQVPGIASIMRFRITLITFALDPRFRIVHLIPFGASTLRECANWAEAAGEL